ncbi:dipeptide ABC transporter ATP-binding protein [Paenacidovorax monticola]|uniref:Dipeptide ABC transporter ATP-binding protein n=1 Tax=Paenacidovorax monticola TaxID=1926868 RepID=A0A7H0HDP1_9BURK|nr:dipeptide ABC transporter ATP-binding protein [Paenacidovorax monticola]QNP58657.1 dipeptide ABC transporter ATP-binding protein [Paenacidovorax monticola]
MSGPVPQDVVVQAQDLRQVYAVRRGWLRASAQLQAVGGVSFEVRAGRTLAVVGESGCGKSTLARMVSLIETPAGGRLVLDGADVTHSTAQQRQGLRKTVQLVFQNPYGSLNPRKRIGATLEAPLAINTTLSRAERAERARAMLAQVGLRPEAAERYPHMFSGGQRQRIAIARALMLNPRLVVADEPVSALDVSVQAQVLNLLADLQAQLGLAYLFISHDLAVVRHIAHDVLVMYLGHAVEQGPKHKVFARPLHPYTQALLASTPGLDAGGARRRIVLQGELPSPLNPPPGCVFSTRCPHVADRCRAERPLQRPLDERLVACHFAEQIAEQFPAPPTGAA